MYLRDKGVWSISSTSSGSFIGPKPLTRPPSPPSPDAVVMVTAGGSYPLGSFHHELTILRHSFLSIALTRASSSDNPRSSRLFRIPSPQLILGLPTFLAPLILEPVILLTILSSSILSTCPNHLSPLCSAL